MKKIIGIFAFTMIFASCSMKQVNYGQRTISVSGRGTVTLEADSATIRAAVITRAGDVLSAARQNAEKMSAVHAALNENGIKSENISTENFNVYQETKYNARTQENVLGNYCVTNEILVTVKDISKIGTIVDLCLKSGANSLSSITYGVTNSKTAEKQARTAAIQQAQENANLLAGASGAQLGKVLQIKETSAPFPASNFMKMAAVSEAESGAFYSNESATPVSNAKTVVSVNVEAVYLLK